MVFCSCSKEKVKEIGQESPVGSGTREVMGEVVFFGYVLEGLLVGMELLFVAALFGCGPMSTPNKQISLQIKELVTFPKNYSSKMVSRVGGVTLGASSQSSRSIMGEISSGTVTIGLELG